MKKCFKESLLKLFLIIRIFFEFLRLETLNLRINQIYTLWISVGFKEIGDCLISYPIYVNGAKYISVGDNCSFDKRLRLDAYDFYASESYFPVISIGNNVSIQMDCHIGAINQVTIGNNVLIASKVYISDHFHGRITADELHIEPVKRKLFSKGPVIIGNNVWIGEGVVIMPGVCIGDNCIVGANSVVTKSFPKNVVIGGNPAKLIKQLVV
jgi:acetyltransferase-like isoleucine patch superfamily enzyme